MQDYVHEGGGEGVESELESVAAADRNRSVAVAVVLLECRQAGAEGGVVTQEGAINSKNSRRAGREGY